MSHSGFRRIMKSLWRFAVHTAVMLVLICAVFGLYVVLLQSNGNLHTVVDGVLYRAAQPDEREVQDYHARLGIKTIVNLRGKNVGSPWYENEVRAATALGITHVDFRMSARRQLTQQQAQDLIEILRNAEKPVLVHCNSGSDRTGLASALFLAAVEKSSEEKAEEQLSLKFGHVGIPYVSSSYAMDETFEAVEAWLGYNGS